MLRYDTVNGISMRRGTCYGYMNMQNMYPDRRLLCRLMSPEGTGTTAARLH